MLSLALGSSILRMSCKKELDTKRYAPPCYRSTCKGKVKGQETENATVELSSPVLFHQWNRLCKPMEPVDSKKPKCPNLEVVRKNIKAIKDVIENEPHLISEIGKGLFGPNDRRGEKEEVGFDNFGGGGKEIGNCGGNCKRGSSIFERGGGALAIRSMESKDGLGGRGLVVIGGRSSSVSKIA
ncbi:hypothetical protein Tco_0845719 [Tanacetum coccineum]